MTTGQGDAELPGMLRVARFDGIEASTGAGGPVARFDLVTVTDGAVPAAVDLAGAGGARRAGHVASFPAADRAAGGEAAPVAAIGVAITRDAPVADLGDSEPEASRAGHRAPPAARRRAGGRSEDSERRRSRAAARGTPPAEPEPDADPQGLARSICLRLLTDRARTRQELAEALRRKGVPDETAAAVLDRFADVGLIDDAAFAGQWVRSRHAVRGLGRRAIALELRRKGVADEVAGEALATVDAAAEDQRARRLVDRKLRAMPVGSVDERAIALRRLAGMLARKGYSAGVAYRVVREALAEHGADIDDLDAAPPED